MAGIEIDESGSDSVQGQQNMGEMQEKSPVPSKIRV